MHSFADEGHSVFDCIPIEQKPSLKASGKAAARPPPDLPEERKTGTRVNMQAREVETHSSTNRKDKFGNVMFCPPGTIPLRRITVEELARFETMRHYSQKNPMGPGRHPLDRSPSASNLGHRYTHASLFVDNLGGHGFLNLWNPSVDTSKGEIFPSELAHWTAQVQVQIYSGIIICVASHKKRTTRCKVYT